jgi:minimal PKS ketosynthase (KS/KS alpha)
VANGPGLRRTAVTGVGVVAPGGVTRDSFWETITAGRTSTRKISFFDPKGFRSQIAAEADFDPVASGLSAQEARRMDRYIQFAAVAAMEALNDAALLVEEADRTASMFASLDRGKSAAIVLEEFDRERMAVTLGSAVGGTMALEEGYVATSNSGEKWLVDPAYAPPFLYAGLIPSSLASEVALKFGAHGPATVISTGCTSGIDAVGYGHQLIQDGEADIVISGAAESPISPISMACFDPIKATSRRNDDPAHASRPFDRDYERGAHIYCEVTGFASRGNAFHMTGLKPDALEMTEAVEDAMRQGNTRPEEIGYINAHGSGTKQNDRHETGAYKNALGDHAYNVPISSIKSMIGHSLGAIGAIEMATCALVIERGVVPPTANWENRDPECDLDYTPNEARMAGVDVALSTASGFGGFQSAMILSRPPELSQVSA